MRWCDQHQNEFADDEFVQEDSTWYHTRDGRHPADEPLPTHFSSGDWGGPTGGDNDWA